MKQPVDKDLLYVDFDEQTGLWCVFDDNGFAHHATSTELEADKLLNQMTGN